MTRITDERLTELAAHFEQEERRMRGLGHHKDDADILKQNAATAAALRELQAARELLMTLAAQWSGETGSTKRSDCMAVLARAHLRDYGQAHD